MTVVSSDYSADEAVQILNETLRLLDTPETFTQGKWRCPVVDIKSGKQKKNAEDRPMFAYCVEGAINQATLNLLGWDRALAIAGMDRPRAQNDYNELCFIESGMPARKLSVNVAAAELFHDELVEFGWQEHYLDPQYAAEYCSARAVNDATDKRSEAYGRVLQILRFRRKQVKAEIAS